MTWGGFDDERVEALDLPFEVIHAGTDAALFAELESAYQREAPIMLWIYAPHWAGPPSMKAHGSSSPNIPPSVTMILQPASIPMRPMTAGKPFGEIWKVGWAGVKDKWPGAYEAIKALHHRQ